VRDLVLEYYRVLGSVLRSQPGLRRCLTRCRHCRIFFLTHPRNAGRDDLRCPFGCRQAHRKRGSTRRSVSYYQTPDGRFKKQLQNGRRRQRQVRSAERRSDERGFEPGMVAYVGMVVSLIEGRPVDREEILAMLTRAVRQHSMAQAAGMDYVVGQPRGDPGRKRQHGP
jgi:hypothetical protein